MGQGNGSRSSGSQGTLAARDRRREEAAAFQQAYIASEQAIVVQLARQHTQEAFHLLVEIARSAKNELARMRACELIIDWAYGKRGQQVTRPVGANEGNVVVEIVDVIDRTSVDARRLLGEETAADEPNSLHSVARRALQVGLDPT